MIQRTVRVEARITKVWVKIASLVKRTPSSSEPSVMPVAAKDEIAHHHVAHVVFAAEVDDAGGAGAVAMLLVRRHEPSLHLAADAGERGGGEHAFGRAADAHINVDAGFQRLGHVDHAGDIAVADQAKRGAGRAHLLDELGVARAVEDADGDLAQRHALGERQAP